LSIWEVTPKIATEKQTEKAIKKLKDVDKDGMLEAVLSMPTQVLSAFDCAEKYYAGYLPMDNSKVHLLGMGGSAIAGDLLNDIFSPKRKVIVHRGTLPPRDSNGIIISSYSGNTKEIIDLTNRSTGGIKSSVFITTGGDLIRYAFIYGIPVWRIPDEFQPRSAIGWSLGLLLGVMVKWRVINGKTLDKIADAAQKLETGLADDGFYQHPIVRASLPIANDLLKKNVIILHSDNCTGIANRLCAQLSENAKHSAFTLTVPEGFHNSIEGIGNSDPSAWTIVYISDPGDSDKLKKDLAISFDYLSEKGFKCVLFPNAEDEHFDLTLSRILMADLVSLFLAANKKIDPTPIPSISALKSGNEE